MIIIIMMEVNKSVNESSSLSNFTCSEERNRPALWDQIFGVLLHKVTEQSGKKIKKFRLSSSCQQMARSYYFFALLLVIPSDSS